MSAGRERHQIQMVERKLDQAAARTEARTFEDLLEMARMVASTLSP